VIGRSDANDIALPWDDEVSRVHATLERLGNEWSVVDDGRSRNGSFIDGVRVDGRARLRDGDAIGVGRTVIVFRSPEPLDSHRTTVARRGADAPPTVSEAQRRVLVALCRPYAGRSYAVPASNREIANELILGIETVKTHMRALFDAFCVGDLPQHQKRAALAQRALETGVVRLRDLR
jgi:pSer/pThr/pTyr-binding forkhead associated (FHA) protein